MNIKRTLECFFSPIFLSESHEKAWRCLELFRSEASAGKTFSMQACSGQGLATGARWLVHLPNLVEQGGYVSDDKVRHLIII